MRAFLLRKRPLPCALIHAAGLVELAAHIHFQNDAVNKARSALERGAPILCDARMVSEGITRKRLPANNQIICTLNDERTPHLAQEMANTRSAAALELWRPHLEGAVVAIGNAPTALFHLLNMLEDPSCPRPAAVIGCPVGFVGAAESKEALWAMPAIPSCIVRGRLGGSAVTERRPLTPWRIASNDSGIHTGHGLRCWPGAGSQDLMSVRADRLIRGATHVAYFRKKGRKGHARSIVEGLLAPGIIELPMEYPVTTEIPFDDPQYNALLSQFYSRCVAQLIEIANAGDNVVVLCEGDPFFYGSFMHLYTRCSTRCRCR